VHESKLIWGVDVMCVESEKLGVDLKSIHTFGVFFSNYGVLLWRRNMLCEC
jgi:hypothetical protein